MGFWDSVKGAFGPSAETVGRQMVKALDNQQDALAVLAQAGPRARVPALVHALKLLHLDDRFDEAAPLVTHLATLDPVAALKPAVDIANHTGNPALVLVAAEAAARVHPDNVTVRATLALALAASGRGPEALAIVDRADPNDADLALARVDVLVALGRRDDARAAAKALAQHGVGAMHAGGEEWAYWKPRVEAAEQRLALLDEDEAAEAEATGAADAQGRADPSK